VYKSLKHDADASKERLQATEPDRFAYTKNAPQEQKAEETWSVRSAGAAPENRMEPAPSENRDAAMAASAAKTKK
jgi:hypothetical protein